MKLDYKKAEIDQLEADNVYLTTQMTNVAIDKIKSTDEPFFMYKGTLKFQILHFLSYPASGYLNSGRNFKSLKIFKYDSFIGIKLVSDYKENKFIEFLVSRASF